ncbi:MAG TPA: hypothetical protein VJL85_06095 [Gaiellaceae bacterium]|nr:hypothetical protein [Gaiellaceae bacterium]
MYRALWIAATLSVLVWIGAFFLYGGTGAFECAPCSTQDRVVKGFYLGSGLVMLVLLAALILTTAGRFVRERRRAV